MKSHLLLFCLTLNACQSYSASPRDASPVSKNDGWDESWRAEPFCDTANRDFDETVLTPPRLCH